MKVKARAPGTCGEYIQGIYEDAPCLISSPLARFSETLVEAGTGESNLREKARTGIDIFLERFALDPALLKEVDITTTSEIPTGIGMASSTADIASAVAALAAYTGVELSEDALAEICIAVEPSDNLMYEKLNLFNHYSGEVYDALGLSLTLPVTVVEFSEVVDTVDFGYETEFDKDIIAFQEVLEDFITAARDGDIPKLAAACTESARLNQRALYKAHLEDVLSAARAAGGYGILIGHSGSVIGVFESDAFDYAGFVDALKKIEVPYSGVYRSTLVPGGVRIEVYET